MSRPNNEFRSARRKAMVKQASERRKATRAACKSAPTAGKWIWKWERYDAHMTPPRSQRPNALKAGHRR